MSKKRGSRAGRKATPTAAMLPAERGPEGGVRTVALYLEPLELLPSAEPRALKALGVKEGEVRCSDSVLRIVELLHATCIEWAKPPVDDEALRRLLVGNEDERRGLAPRIAVAFYRSFQQHSWYRRRRRLLGIETTEDIRAGLEEDDRWTLRCVLLLRWIEAMGFGLPSSGDSPWEFSLPLLADVDVALELDGEEASARDVLIRVVRNLYYFGTTSARDRSSDYTLRDLLVTRVRGIRFVAARAFANEVRSFIAQGTRLAAVTGQDVGAVMGRARLLLRWLEALALAVTFGPNEREARASEQGGLIQSLEGAVTDVDWLVEFDRRLRSVVAKGETTEEGLVPRARGTSSTPSALRDDFTQASLGDLVDALVPDVSEAAIKRLEDLIREAQENPPEDRESFVAQVNRVLDAQNLRLRVEGEEHLARLSMKRGSINFAVAGGRGHQGFSGKAVRVVQVAEGYGRNGRGTSARHLSPSEPL